MKNFFSKCIGYWLEGIVILLVGIDICVHLSCDVIKSDHIILVFVGILATFIVVSNYAQINIIEGKFQTLRDDFGKIREESESLKKNLEKTELTHKLHLYFQEANIRLVTAINTKNDKDILLTGASSYCLDAINLLSENVNLVDEEFRGILNERMRDIVLEIKKVPECRCTRSDPEDIKYKIKKNC
jgi:hypothetical protein